MIRICLILLLAWFSGCGNDGDARIDHAARFGLRHSALGRPVIEAAVRHANLILDHDSGVRFCASWVLAEGAHEAGNIPVYLIASDDLPGSSNCFIPNGERCVFVNAAWAARAGDLLWSNGLSTLPVEPVHIWSLLLLHEAGHLAHGHGGAYESSSIDLNRVLTASKERELDADRFAASQIRSASQVGQPLERFLAGHELLHTVASVTWNETRNRLIEHFGASAVGNPRVFWDAGYSHPNLRLRMLFLSHQLSPTHGSQESIDSFEEIRGRENAPLFEATSEGESR